MEFNNTMYKASVQQATKICYETRIFNLSFVLSSNLNIEYSLVKNAIEYTIYNEESLRTQVHTEEGNLVQSITNESNIIWLDSLPEALDGSRIQIHLNRIDANRIGVIIALPESLVDIESVVILYQRLSEQFGSKGIVYEEQALPLQYADYIAVHQSEFNCTAETINNNIPTSPSKVVEKQLCIDGSLSKRDCFAVLSSFYKGIEQSEPFYVVTECAQRNSKPLKDAIGNYNHTQLNCMARHEVDAWESTIAENEQRVLNSPSYALDIASSRDLHSFALRFDYMDWSKVGDADLNHKEMDFSVTGGGSYDIQVLVQLHAEKTIIQTYCNEHKENEIRGKMILEAFESFSKDRTKDKQAKTESGSQAIDTFLRTLTEKSIFLSVKDGKLKCKAAPGALTAPIKKQIGQNKQAIIDTLSKDKKAPTFGLIRAPEADDYPISNAQQGLLLSSKIEGANSQYNLVYAIEVTGEFSEDKFHSAIERLLERHEILRSTFREQDGQMWQFVNHNFEFPLFIREVSNQSGEHDEVKKLIEEEMQYNFDYYNEIMLRINIVKHSENKFSIVINANHIIIDGISMPILISELSEFYADPGVSKPTPGFHYKDYAFSQRDWAEKGKYDKARQYWIDKLSVAPQRHSLPTRYNADSEIGNAAQSIKFEISGSKFEKIISMSKSLDVTVFMLLESLFALSVASGSGQSGVCIGTQVTGRNVPELDSLVGFFVNTLPLYTEVNKEQSIKEFVSEQKAMILDAFEIQDYPFELIVDSVCTSRNMLTNPLVQLMFSMQPKSNDVLSLDNSNIRMLNFEKESAQFDLVVNVSESDHKLGFNWLFKKDIFSEDYIQTLISLFDNTIERFIGHEAQTVEDLMTATPQQVELINSFHREQSKVLTYEHSFQKRFAQQVQNYAERLAVTEQGRSLNYRELEEVSNRLANCFEDMGFEAGERIAVFLERGIEALVTILACIKSGITYVPIDPYLPESRVKRVLEEVELSLFVSLQSLGNSYQSLPVDWLEVDEIFEADGFLSSYSTEYQPQQEWAPEDPVYTLFTSGSTGVPKGVNIGQVALSNYLEHVSQTYFSDDKERGVVCSALTFDATVTTLLGTLYSGRTLEFVPSGDDELDLLKQSVITNPVSVYKLSPAHLKALTLLFTQSELSTTPHVFIVGGEQLTYELVRKVNQQLPAATLINEYGPTEATVGCSIKMVAPGEQFDCTNIPIGLPIQNTDLFVVNSKFEPVPIGAVGELLISGAGLANGYLKEEQTGKAFPVLDTLENGQKRCYQTGDLVRWKKPGELEFVSRKDQQLKLRGYRIEPEEISNAINSTDLVEGCITHLDKEQESLQVFCSLDKRKNPATFYLLKAIEDKKIEENKVYIWPNQMEVCGINQLETEYLYEEIFLENAYLQGGIKVEDGDCILDVGANIGTFSMQLASMYSNLNILAFEPIADIADVLEVNSQMHGYQQINVIRKGLAETPKTAEFNYYHNISVFSGIAAGEESNHQSIKSFLANNYRSENFEDASLDELIGERLVPKKVNVELSTVSQIIVEKELKSIDLLKIDVERSERGVLEGIEERHWPLVKQIVVELHKDGEDAAWIEQLLVDKGFDISEQQHDVLENSELYVLFAVREKKQNANALPSPRTVTNRTVIKDGLLSACQNQLPHYMVPSTVSLWSQFPVNRHGKIDIKKTITKSTQFNQRVMALPTTATEEALHKCWKELLSLSEISTDQRFFELGGHSLIALRLINHVNDLFGVNISIRDVFENDTISLLAALLDKKVLVEKMNSSRAKLADEDKKEVMF